MACPITQGGHSNGAITVLPGVSTMKLHFSVIHICYLAALCDAMVGVLTPLPKQFSKQF